MSSILVFLGAGIGGLLRYGVTVAGARYAATFPWMTLTVNVLGSFAMGLLMGALVKRGWSETWRLFLGTGMLGGFTTFSAFSLDVSSLIDRGAGTSAIAYVVASVVVGIVALYAGLIMSRMLS